jgi:hypothetical protein
MLWNKISPSEVRRDAEVTATQLFADGSISSGVALLLALGEEYTELVTKAVPAITSDLVQGIESFLRRGTLEETQNADAVWVCLTDALAAIVTAGTPDATRLKIERNRLDLAPNWARARWYEVCATRILELDETDREAWLNACEAAPDRDQQSTIEPAVVSVARLRAVWKIEDLFRLWDEDACTAFRLAEYAPLRILRCADQLRWFCAIDRWQDPRLVQGALFCQELSADPSTVVDLLGVAYPCFDCLGVPTGNSAAIVLCKIMLDCVQKALKSRVNEASSKTEVATLLARLTAALLNRPDGARLGAALMTWLFDKVVLRRVSADPAGDSQRMVLEELSRALACHRIPVDQYRKFASERRVLSATRTASLWQRDLPALLACSRTLGGDSEDVRDAQRKWLRDLLLVSREWSQTNVDPLIRELGALQRT